MTQAILTIESFKEGDQVRVKSGKVYAIIWNPALRRAHSYAQGKVLAVQTRNGKTYGPSRYLNLSAIERVAS